MAIKAIINLVLLAYSVTNDGGITYAVDLAWNDANPATQYSVFRFQGPCGAFGGVFTKIASVVAKSYVDAMVKPGPYCYQVVAMNGSSSLPIPVVIQSSSSRIFPPSALTVTIP